MTAGAVVLWVLGVLAFVFVAEIVASSLWLRHEIRRLDRLDDTTDQHVGMLVRTKEDRNE